MGAELHMKTGPLSQQKQPWIHYKLGRVTCIFLGCNTQNLHWQVLWTACTPELSRECLHTGTLLSAQVSNSPVTHGICVLLEQAAGQAAWPAFLTWSASKAAGRGDRACPGHRGTKCVAVWLSLQIPSGLPFFLPHSGKPNIGLFLCLFSKRQSSCQTHTPKLFRIRVPQVPVNILLPVQRARTP